MKDLLISQMCDLQAKIFTLSIEKGYDSPSFIKAFMNSEVAKELDSDFNHVQWAGLLYVFEKLEKEISEITKKTLNTFDKETMYWAGYLYRYWHYYTGESSKQIYKIANAKTINATYYSYHSMGLEFAIDRLKETHIEK